MESASILGASHDAIAVYTRYCLTLWVVRCRSWKTNNYDRKHHNYKKRGPGADVVGLDPAFSLETAG